VAGLMRRAPLAGALLLLLGLVWAIPPGAWAGSSLVASPRIAVAPFALDESLAESGLDLAGALAERLAARPLGRVVLPSELGVVAEARPPAQRIRDWAEQAQVDAVVVGSVGRAGDGQVEAWVETRSGHTGAVEERYRIEPTSEWDLDEQVEQLATRILSDLGYEGLAGDALPPVGATGAAEPAKDEEKDEDTLLGRLRSDEPVSIESDEIEIVDRAGLRHLVFRREVKVVQGDVTLLTDHLEAFYPEGASQPDRLEATGNVRVRQGDRSARCESATYLRQEQVVVCRGQAEILRECDRVRGGEIRFDLERDTVRVVGAASVVLQAKGECSGGVQ
jgi:lipopolysaccharide transport protein LptA